MGRVIFVGALLGLVISLQLFLILQLSPTNTSTNKNIYIADFKACEIGCSGHSGLVSVNTGRSCLCGDGEILKAGRGWK